MVMVLAVLAIYQYINFHNSSEIDKFWYSLQGRGLLRFSLPPETAEVKWAWFTESLECHTLMAFHSHGTSHYIMFTVSPQKQQRHKVLTLHNETYKSNVMWHTRKSMQHIAQSTPSLERGAYKHFKWIYRSFIAYIILPYLISLHLQDSTEKSNAEFASCAVAWPYFFSRGSHGVKCKYANINYLQEFKEGQVCLYKGVVTL